MTTVHKNRQIVLRALQASDLAILCAVMVYVLYIRTETGSVPFSHPTWTLFGWLIASLIAWHLALAGANLYRSHRLAGGFPAVEILRGVSMGVGEHWRACVAI